MVAISKATGLKVQVETLSLDLSHGLGLKAGNLLVQTQKSGHDLFSAEALFLTARLAPVLEGNFEVAHAVVVKPRIHLGDTPPASKNPSAPQGMPTSSPTSSGGIKVEQIQTILRDMNLKVDFFEVEDGVFAVDPSLPPAVVSFRLYLRRPSPQQMSVELEGVKAALGPLAFEGGVKTE